MLFGKQVQWTLAVLAAFGSAQNDAVAPEDSAVVKLNTETFEKFLSENPLVMAEFFAPWCGHCKKLAPEYVEAASQLEPKNIAIAQIDCTENQELCQKQGIRGYPSLKVYKNGNLEPFAEYQGARSSDAIISYMLKQAEAAVRVVEDEAEFQDMLHDNEEPLVVDGGVSDFNATFYELADTYRDEFSFAQYGNDGKLSLYLPGEAEPIIYEGEDFDIESIAKWVSVESFPYYGEINGETFRAYMASDVPLAYFFYTDKEERESYADFFKELGKKFRGKINFAGLDASQFGRHAQNLNHKEQFPLFAIHDIAKDLKYGLPQLAEEEFEALEKPLALATDDIAKFVEKFLQGEAQAIVKSEEIPEVQEAHVFKIVGKTHDEIVRDPTKDVLVKYYAAWCGHCKRLAPIYEELAEIFHTSDGLKEKVLIANVDATLNDVQGVDIHGFPTLYLWPAGENTEPILYEGARTIEAFVDFIKEHGANAVDGVLAHQAFLEKIKKESEEAVKEEQELEQDEL